jgi:superfamily II DNA or RNA helicase
MNYYKGPKLREWQLDAISKWKKTNKGIIQAVPGSGKTFLAISTFCELHENDKDLKILIVCPRLSLIEQWEKVILDNTKFKKEDIYEISSKKDIAAHKKAQGKLHKHTIFISTFNQIKQFFSQKEWQKEKWFLIVDEMHNTTEGYNFPDTIPYKLGLSATPKKRGKNSDFNLGEIIYIYSFNLALKDNIILDPVFKLVLYSVNEPVFKKLNKKSSSTEEMLEDAYDEILSDEEPQNIEEMKDLKAKKFSAKSTDFIGIQKILKNKFHTDKENAQKSLIFVNRIKKANILNEVLHSQFGEGISLSHHSKSDNYNKKDHFNNVKADFEKGKFKILISVNALGEGIDFPYASHGIIASPIYNPTNFIQKVGRLLRTYKNHKQAIIYYYIPSELINRILTDESLSPNYLKSVLKIASERGNLYFVDRETLKEEKGEFSDLIVQGSAYERNSEIKMLKVPSHIDMVLRFSKKLFPESFKHWRTYCEEDDFTELEERILKNSKILLRCGGYLLHHLEKINDFQNKFKKTEFKDYNSIKKFVNEGVRNNFVVKIKHGAELFSKDNHAEKELLRNTINSELKEFVGKEKSLKAHIKNLKTAIDTYEKGSRKKKLENLNKISHTFFKVQSDYLDQLELITLAKRFEESESITITFGRDIFIMSHSKRVFAYPEDFGLSRWKFEEEKKKVIKLTSKEKFCEELLKTPPIEIENNWSKVSKEIATKTKWNNYNKKEILEQLEKFKTDKKHSLMEIIVTTDAVKKIED